MARRGDTGAQRDRKREGDKLSRLLAWPTGERYSRRSGLQKERRAGVRGEAEGCELNVHLKIQELVRNRDLGLKIEMRVG